MIKRLRLKFIVATTVSLAVVLAVILGGVNLMSYQKEVHINDKNLCLVFSKLAPYSTQR